ncbi:hypothetical protein [Microvirga lotononidis]|uniref:Uncharacterized protein n=1 Tax=Microvirga lotononidis TaxID=864069 RepID=I4YRQ6_9HYPH|nr:hypothetical protein [Microvirga lotononidis]EIM26648.1 hypothetical protein MicloDRAFT_00031970 [Microvirga lotononidis]WQO32072.1 hypothetical protein U0023_35310 [Microvirga lotononidis]
MNRLALTILTTLALGSPIMARDNTYEPVRPPTGGPKSDHEALLHSDRSRELDEIVRLTLQGNKEAAEEAYEAYRKKYNPLPMGSYPGAQEQARPRPRQEFGTPMTLPPEAR